MVSFFYQNNFKVRNELSLEKWIKFVVDQELKEAGELNFILCEDNYLLDMNVKYLKHNTLTDVITFDYTIDNIISGDVYISIERVQENASDLDLHLLDELNRVMVHGVLHLCGYKDKTDEELLLMRSKEDYYLSLRTFKN